MNKQVINLLWMYLYYVLNYLVFLKAGFILRRVILKFRMLESLSTFPFSLNITIKAEHDRHFTLAVGFMSWAWDVLLTEVLWPSDSEVNTSKPMSEISL